MGTVIFPISITLVAALLVLLGYWLLIATEGVYLGRRMVVWLYDLYANRYDDIKHYQYEFEQMLIAQPLMDAIDPLKAPLVLDVATGTGRLPFALFNHMDFQGRIIGIDLSRKMLHHAARKLSDAGERAQFIWWSAESLPFADNTFDIVTSLEALEFMSNPTAVLREMARVLRPGGLLLTSRRIGVRYMPGKVWTEDEMRALLVSFDIEVAFAEPWESDYDKVWGQKYGDSRPVGARPLAEILHCPACPDSLMVVDGDYWYCADCRARAVVGKDGVIELYNLET